MRLLKKFTIPWLLIIFSITFICVAFTLCVNFAQASIVATSTMRFYEGGASARLQADSPGIDQAAWDIAHDSIAGAINDTFEVLNAIRADIRYDIPEIVIARYQSIYDTSELPDNAIIISAKIFFYIGHLAFLWNGDNLEVRLVSSSPASSTVASVEDYSHFGTTSLSIADKAVEDWEKENYNYFEINNTRKEAINSTGYTTLGLRFDADADDKKPLERNSIVELYTNDYPGTDKDPYLEITYTVPETPSEVEPVIVVPGIVGSWGVGGVWLMDPILHTYDNLIEAMDSADDYELNVNLFPMPYDWRKSNIETVDLLKEKIKDVKIKTGSERVDIVGHSMGGLVARHYVQGEDYEDDVDQVVFLNTPHQGATESYLAYEGAYFLGLLGPVKKFILSQHALSHGYLSLTKYIQEQIPSTGQLLPIYDYLEDKVKNDWTMRVYPAGYPENSFLEILNLAFGVSSLIANADVTNIYSYADTAVSPTTLRTIRVNPDKRKWDNKWEHGEPACKNKNDESCWVTSPGDKTVPMNSLESLSGVEEIVMTDTTHRGIVSAAQQDVIEVLTGARPDDFISSTWGAIRRLLFIRVYSPVDFLVIDPDGKMVGKNFSDNTVINELEEDGAFYSGFDRVDEFATLINPEPGEYRVILEGVEDGSFGLGIDILEEDGLTEPEENIINGYIREGEQREYRFIIGEDGNVSEVEMRTLFDKLIADLDDLNSDSGINKDSVYQILRLRFEHLAKKYEDMLDEDRLWRQKLYKARVLLGLNIIKKELRFYERKNWLTPGAYDLLISDINEIIDELM